jgi:phosphatidate cytidylyltransferase
MQWAPMICVFRVSHKPALMSLHILGFGRRNVLLIAFLALIAQSSDLIEYVWGKLFGLTKLALHLSPSKTVEGLLGGTRPPAPIGAAFAGLMPFSFLQAATMSPIIVVMGFLWKLLTSAMKWDRKSRIGGVPLQGTEASWTVSTQSSSPPRSSFT